MLCVLCFVQKKKKKKKKTEAFFDPLPPPSSFLCFFPHLSVTHLMENKQRETGIQRKSAGRKRERAKKKRVLSFPFPLCFEREASPPPFSLSSAPLRLSSFILARFLLFSRQW